MNNISFINIVNSLISENTGNHFSQIAKVRDIFETLKATSDKQHIVLG